MYLLNVDNKILYVLPWDWQLKTIVRKCVLNVLFSSESKVSYIAFPMRTMVYFIGFVLPFILIQSYRF